MTLKFVYLIRPYYIIYMLLYIVHYLLILSTDIVINLSFEKNDIIRIAIAKILMFLILEACDDGISIACIYYYNCTLIST